MADKLPIKFAASSKLDPTSVTKEKGKVTFGYDTVKDKAKIYLDTDNSTRIEIQPTYAEKLATDGGTSTKPIYIKDGVPTVISLVDNIKGTDISADKIPSTKAVQTFVEGKGYVTTVNGKTGASIVLTGGDIPFSTYENAPIEDCIYLTLNMADAAQSAADTAATKADAAQSTADTAVTKADAAQSAADTAATKADAAQSTADTAVTKADAAQSTADTAVTKADAAQSTADTAVTKADAAQSTADTAVTKANTVQNIANTAARKADAAKNTADNAMPKDGGTFTGNVNIAKGFNLKIYYGDYTYMELKESGGKFYFSSCVNGFWNDLIVLDSDGNISGGQLKTIVDSGVEKANDAQLTANRAQKKANNAMPKSGGTFTGSVQAATGTSAVNGELKNILVKDQISSVVFDGIRYIEFRRK